MLMHTPTHIHTHAHTPHTLHTHTPHTFSPTAHICTHTVHTNKYTLHTYTHNTPHTHTYTYQHHTTTQSGFNNKETILSLTWLWSTGPENLCNVHFSTLFFMVLVPSSGNVPTTTPATQVTRFPELHIPILCTCLQAKNSPLFPLRTSFDEVLAHGPVTVAWNRRCVHRSWRAVSLVSARCPESRRV